MRSAILFALAFLTLPSSATADSFRHIARSLDAQPGLERQWSPGSWIARIATRAIRPEGIEDLRMVRFTGRADLTASSRAAIAAAETSGYTRVVQVTGRNGGVSSILARPRRGDRIQMIILAQEEDETILLELLLDRETFLEHIASAGNGNSAN